MKKIFSVLVVLILIGSFFVMPASATGSVAVNGAATVTVGDNAEFVVNVKDCGEASSVSISLTVDNGLELVSGEWIKSGRSAIFDKQAKKGELSGLNSSDINGNVFKFVLKAPEFTVNAQSVSINVIVKKDDTEIMNVSTTKSVKIGCANHNFTEWSQTKAPTCSEAGTDSRSCSVCQIIETREIKAEGHQMGTWHTYQYATCEAKGEQKRSCVKCDYVETAEIQALGHKFSNPIVIKEPTCTEKGEQEGLCEVCNESAKGEMAMRPHNYSETVVTKFPTETEAGLCTKTCIDCGQSVSEEIPALGAESNKENNDLDIDYNVSEGEGDDVSIWIVGSILVLSVIAVIFILIFKNKLF